MVRIAYDSDTQRATFRDSDGSMYEGGAYGGDLVLISRPKHKSQPGAHPVFVPLA
jgi:hypothetical protein